MRILKGDEHILMPSPVAVHGKRFWSLGILNYFSFDDPDTLLSETRMWKEVPPLFGNAPVVLDTGAFKPRANFWWQADAGRHGEKPGLPPGCGCGSAALSRPLPSSAIATGSLWQA